MKSASQMKIATNLEIIMAAMEKEAEHGHKILMLYRTRTHELGFDYEKTFNYNSDDLNKLKELGYKVTIGETEKFYKGFLWWKKQIRQIDYHYISW